ncbi:hypothetical protein [Leptospira sp. GIMC2001]|uniref:hypothetical protein n=1 Tax=Leptospira sp. GIMC2001 TaxID=1513297 RepID=UPI002348FDEF|nr:hypothetical protein [Leptospira sp. GIMC2001]WCL50645.1 hypothetical protein O4O04_07470 [Leptospira sp. GIMC2001]
MSFLENSGIPNPGAFLIFILIKLLGYTGFSIYMTSYYDSHKDKFWIVGIVRTLIGLAIGGFLINLTSFTSYGFSFFIAIVPIRIVEWWILIFIFFDRSLSMNGENWEIVYKGVVFSFLLDIPSIIGFFSIGELRIC